MKEPEGPSCAVPQPIPDGKGKAGFETKENLSHYWLLSPTSSTETCPTTGGIFLSTARVIATTFFMFTYTNVAITVIDG